MTEKNASKARKERSPSYPIISLKPALERLELFDKTFGRHPAPFQKVGMAWGIKEGSSQANSVLAALKAFGLVEYEGSGSERKVTISESGRKYLRAQQEEIKNDVIRDAALKPKAIAKFWPVWGADRPPDAICLDTLVLEDGFNENAAPTFLRVYDETIAFSGLGASEPESDPPQDGEVVAFADEMPPKVKEGDLIQWTASGVNQFRVPAKVLGLSNDGAWVFTDQGQSAIPLSEVTVVSTQSKQKVETPPQPPRQVLSSMNLTREGGDKDSPISIGYRKATFPLDEGDVTIVFPDSLSADGYDELDEYLKIFLKKGKKKAGEWHQPTAGKSQE